MGRTFRRTGPRMAAFWPTQNETVPERTRFSCCRYSVNTNRFASPRPMPDQTGPGFHAMAGGSLTTRMKPAQMRSMFRLFRPWEVNGKSLSEAVVSRYGEGTAANYF